MMCKECWEPGDAETCGDCAKTSFKYRHRWSIWAAIAAAYCGLLYAVAN